MKTIKEGKIVSEWLTEGVSLRKLATKYGTSSSSIYRIVKKHSPDKQTSPVQEALPDDVAALKALLRAERLKNELLNNIIDIADKELGINIRKKSGTRQSE